MEKKQPNSSENNHQLRSQLLSINSTLAAQIWYKRKILTNVRGNAVLIAHQFCIIYDHAEVPDRLTLTFADHCTIRYTNSSIFFDLSS